MRIKMLSLIVLLGGVLLMHGLAWGVPTACDTAAVDTVGEFRGLTNGCEIGDKRFTYVANTNTTLNVPDAVALSIQLLTFPAGDEYLLTLTFDPTGNGKGPVTYAFDYDIQIVSTTFTFQNVQLDSTVAGDPVNGTVTVKKQEGSNPAKFTSLTSTNGGSVGPNSMTAGTTLIHVQDDITVDTNRALKSTAETFTQSGTLLAPEPSTFFLVGFGLVALGILRRRSWS